MMQIRQLPERFNPTVDEFVMVLLRLAPPAPPPVATEPTTLVPEELLGVGRLNNKKSANCKVSSTRYHDAPKTLLKNMIMFKSTRKLYRFFSFRVMLASACCC